MIYRSVEVNKSFLESEEPGKANALVTGGSGMLGKEIVRCLIEDGGYKVYSLDLFIPEEEKRDSQVCSYIQADITNFDDLLKATRGMDVVFHTAAILPTVLGAKDSDFDDVNVKGTENVIAACKECKVKRLVYTSSIEVALGKNQHDNKNMEIDEEDYPLPKHPLNAYVRTKGAAEKAVLSANGESGLSTCAVRPGGIFEMVLPSIIKRPTCLGKAPHNLKLVSSKDVAKVEVQLDKLLSEKSKIAEGKVFILATNLDEGELLKAIVTELNHDGQRIKSISFSLLSLLTYINVSIHYLTGVALINPMMTTMLLDFVNMHMLSYHVSSARAERELGWKPTPWKELVKKSVKEFKETKKTK